jgi:hypothetical protein
MEGMVGKILEWLVRRFRYVVELPIYLSLPRNSRIIAELTNSTLRMC